MIFLCFHKIDHGVFLLFKLCTWSQQERERETETEKAYRVVKKSLPYLMLGILCIDDIWVRLGMPLITFVATGPNITSMFYTIMYTQYMLSSHLLFNMVTQPTFCISRNNTKLKTNPPMWPFYFTKFNFIVSNACMYCSLNFIKFKAVRIHDRQWRGTKRCRGNVLSLNFIKFTEIRKQCGRWWGMERDLGKVISLHF
jgi:hypothetical protein